MSCAASIGADVVKAGLAAAEEDAVVVRDLQRVAALGSAVGLRKDMFIVDLKLARDIAT